MYISVNNYNSQQTFGTKVYASREALESINKSPAKCRQKAFDHIKGLKENGANDIMLLNHIDKIGGNNVGDIIAADIYIPTEKEGVYKFCDTSYRDYVVDPHTYGNRKKYLNIKDLYKSLVDDLSPITVTISKNSLKESLSKYTEL